MRPYVHFLRYRTSGRLRHSQIFLSWLTAQATRLSLSASVVFETLLKKAGMSSRQVESLVAGEPINIKLPRILGGLAVGATLEVTDGEWLPNDATITYQWKVGGSNVGGATTDEYTPLAADYNKTVACAVTATKSGESFTVTTERWGLVAGLAPVITVNSISGTATQGQTLTASVTVTGIPTPTTETVWLADGVEIEGSDDQATLLLTVDHVGKKITHHVSAANIYGEAENLSSETSTVAGA